MALDGIFLNSIKAEITDVALNSRVDKIYQPSKEEIVIALRTKGQSLKLLISANANSARIHFTKIQLENPKSPPMFCMLLRKHLSTGKLVAVRQNGLDRIINLDFEAINELGDVVVVTIVVEIMGRHSNIILVNQNGKVIDSIKRINDEMSSVRMVLPGVTYCIPPAQNKLNILTSTDQEILTAFENAPQNDVSKAILNTLEGVSPVLARQISCDFLGTNDIGKSSLSSFYKNKYIDEISKLRKRLMQNDYDLTTVLEDNKPRDFTVIDITQYSTSLQKTKYKTPSELLDDFYSERDRVERMKQRSFDLLKLLLNANERITKKLVLQEQELVECENREQLKINADLINTNSYSIQKGQTSVVLQNYYDENYCDVTIKLDPMLTASQNAQKYYNEYRKAATAEKKLKELMINSRQELIYLDSVYDAVSRTKGESELLEIREELSEQGYIKRLKKKQSRMIKAQPPLRYRSTDGFLILCGRNNKQNDKLTLKEAKNYDMWLHTQDVAGSHVIVVSDNKEITNVAIEQAAIIAAYNSKARESAQVAVDYTLIRYVKKPSGAKPGMVIFTNNKTAYVTPNETLVESLKVE